LPLELLSIAMIVEGSIGRGVSLADLVRTIDVKIMMFTRGSNLHNVQLFTVHVRSNHGKQISMQMVIPRSKGHRLSQEVALAPRTYTLIVQS
jgi:hypothetical protein